MLTSALFVFDSEGVMKPGALHYSKSPEAIAAMAALKRAMDPNGILNPYKVLPQRE